MNINPCGTTCGTLSQVGSDCLDAETEELSRQLCTLLRMESARSGRPWVPFSHLAELYHRHYGRALVQQFQRAGYPDSGLFWRSHRQVFSTYATPVPENPYVAEFAAVNPVQDFRRGSQGDRPHARRRRRPSAQASRKLS
jgi:hypothetical protein